MTQIAFASDDLLTLKVPDSAKRRSLTRIALASGRWEEVVPGLADITVKYDPERIEGDAARTLLLDQLNGAANAEPAFIEAIDIPVCYDPAYAPDAAMVAARLGIAARDLPRWHSEQNWTVDMIGFQPGFAYLSCAGPYPAIDRLETPRQSVVAGSIGVLGGRCGIYPFAGPGGWPLIGRTPLTLFDPLADPPALLSPGMAVRFVAIDRDRFEAEVVR